MMLGALLGALENSPLQLEPTAASGTLSIARGDALLIEAPLSTKPSSVAQARRARVSAPAGLTVAPWVELGADHVRYALRAAPKAALGRKQLSATIELLDAQGASITTLSIQHEVEVIAASGTAVEVSEGQRAYLFHQGHAEATYERLSELHDYLRLDRLDPPPKPERLAKLNTTQQGDVTQFYFHRLRADIARTRLRALAELPERGTADQAARAIGALSKRPTGPAQKARAIDGLTTDRGIALAREKLANLRVDEAEGFLNKLRRSGRLEPKELASVLQLLGGVYMLRSRGPEAQTTFGRALCLVPGQETLVQRPLLREAFELARENPKCKERITVRSIKATRERTETGLSLIVEAPYGPDPHRLGVKAIVQIWGTGGGMAAEQKVDVDLDKRLIKATFKDTGEYENFAGQILLKAFLQDVSGVSIATIGDPDPVSMPVQKGESMSGVNIPWWVWVVIGGAAVIGGATAGAVVLAKNRDSGPTQGIGPIEVTF